MVCFKADVSDTNFHGGLSSAEAGVEVDHSFVEQYIAVQEHADQTVVGGRRPE